MMNKNSEQQPNKKIRTRDELETFIYQNPVKFKEYLESNAEFREEFTQILQKSNASALIAIATAYQGYETRDISNQKLMIVDDSPALVFLKYMHDAKQKLETDPYYKLDSFTKFKQELEEQELKMKRYLYLKEQEAEKNRIKNERKTENEITSMTLNALVQQEMNKAYDELKRNDRHSLMTSQVMTDHIKNKMGQETYDKLKEFTINFVKQNSSPKASEEEIERRSKIIISQVMILEETFKENPDKLMELLAKRADKKQLKKFFDAMGCETIAQFKDIYEKHKDDQQIRDILLKNVVLSGLWMSTQKIADANNNTTIKAVEESNKAVNQEKAQDNLASSLNGIRILKSIDQGFSRNINLLSSQKNNESSNALSSDDLDLIGRTHNKGMV